MLNDPEWILVIALIIRSKTATFSTYSANAKTKSPTTMYDYDS